MKDLVFEDSHVGWRLGWRVWGDVAVRCTGGSDGDHRGLDTLGIYHRRNFGILIGAIWSVISPTEICGCE